MMGNGNREVMAMDEIKLGEVMGDCEHRFYGFETNPDYMVCSQCGASKNKDGVIMPKGEIGIAPAPPITFASDTEKFNTGIYRDDANQFAISHVGEEVMKFCPNGDIYVRGKLTTNDMEVVNGIKEFLKLVGCIK